MSAAVRVANGNRQGCLGLIDAPCVGTYVGRDKFCPWHAVMVLVTIVLYIALVWALFFSAY